MLLAYVRGFLKPDYPQGVVSVVRERLMLAALSAEAQTPILLQQLVSQSAFAPLFRPDNAKVMLERMTEAFGQLLARSEMNLNLAPEELSKKSQAMLQLLESLNTSGFYDQLRQAAEKSIRKVGFDKIGPVNEQSSRH